MDEGEQIDEYRSELVQQHRLLILRKCSMYS